MALINQNEKMWAIKYAGGEVAAIFPYHHRCVEYIGDEDEWEWMPVIVPVQVRIEEIKKEKE